MNKQFDSYRPTCEVEQPEKLTWKEIAEGAVAMLAIVAFVLLIIYFA